MGSYLVVEWLHLLSSVVLVGTGFGSAYYMFFANRSRNVAAQAMVARLVVRADNRFTAPALLVQPASGWVLAQMAAMAEQAARAAAPLPPGYWQYARLWEALGYPAFVALPGVFDLMVAKPAWLS
jgi:uncharacterized membrane protein